jgi:polar amino acid transport system substrate-binding protein
MSMRRSILGLALATGLFGLLACATHAAPGRSKGRLDAILARKELRVGLTADQPPLNMKTRGGETVGLEVDLARALVESMGVRMQLVERSFPELLPALERGDVDLVISGVTITTERNARVAFAGPYFVTGAAILSRDAALTNAQELTALDDPKHRFVTLAGSTSEQFVRTQLPKAQLATTNDYESAVQAVLAGQADAMIGDYLACAVAVWRHPGAGFVEPNSPLTAEPLGIALPPDDPLFVNLVENYLATLEQTGLLAAIKARWLAEGGTWVGELR